MKVSAHQTSKSLRVAMLLTAGNGFLDVFTYLLHGAFATAQTGNVVLLFAGLVHPALGDPWHHLWPIMVFLAGVVIANVLRAPGIAERIGYPIRIALGIQIVLLAVVSLLPADAPALWTTLLVSTGAGLQLGLFRLVRENAYITIATTGNLLRVAESTLAAVRTRRREDRALALVYAGIVGAFILGAVAGALLTDWWGHRASWVVAGIVSAALVLFFVDDYRDRRVSPAAIPVEKELMD